MSATDVAATWTGYGLWAIAIIAAMTALLFVAATIARVMWENYVRQMLWARFQGPLSHVQKILDKPTTDANKAAQIRQYVGRAQRRFSRWAGEEYEPPTAPVPRLKERSPLLEPLTAWVWCDKYEGVRRLGHRDALDGGPQAPVCLGMHWELAVLQRRVGATSGGDAAP